MSKKIFTINLSSGDVGEFESLEQANELAGYTHPGDTYPTRIAALKAIVKYTKEDIQEQSRELAFAQKWLAKDKEILQKAQKELKRKKK